MSDEKSKPRPKQVVLVDDHTHMGKPVPKGTVLDNVSELTASRYPKIFAEENSTPAKKAQAEAKAVADKAKTDADAADAHEADARAQDEARAQKAADDAKKAADAPQIDTPPAMPSAPK